MVVGIVYILNNIDYSFFISPILNRLNNGILFFPVYIPIEIFILTFNFPISILLRSTKRNQTKLFQGEYMSIKKIEINANDPTLAMEQAGMTWIAQECPMLNTVNGKMVETHKAIIRNDTSAQIGVVGKNFGVIQMAEAFSVADVLCKERGINFIQAREWNGGSVVELHAQIKGLDFAVNGNDELGVRFNLRNGFDGTTSLEGDVSILRQVCKNGLVAFKSESNIKIRHTKHAINRLDEAMRIWAGISKWYDMFKTNAEVLAQKQVDVAMVNSFLDKLFTSDSKQSENKKDEVKHLFESGLGNTGKTAWDLYNGTTEFIDHHSKKNADERFEYANRGTGYDLKSRAFDIALAL